MTRGDASQEASQGTRWLWVLRLLAALVIAGLLVEVEYTRRLGVLVDGLQSEGALAEQLKRIRTVLLLESATTAVFLLLAGLTALHLKRLRRGALAVGMVGLSREMALTNCEERFNELAASLPVVVLVTDIDVTRFEYVSPAFEELWGRPVGELYTRPETFDETVHPGDRDEVRKVRSAIGNARTGECTYRVCRPDGSVRWVRERWRRLDPGQGRIPWSTGVVEDVTAEHWSSGTAALEAGVARALGAGGVTTDPLSGVLDLLGRHTGAIRAALWQVSRDGSELELAAFWSRSVALTDERQPVLGRLSRKPCEGVAGLAWIEGVPIWNSPGEVEGSCAVGVPVAVDGSVAGVVELELEELGVDQPHIEELLARIGLHVCQFSRRRRAERHGGEYSRLSGDLLCCIGADGRLVEINPAWVAVTGWSTEELQERPLLDLVHPEDRPAMARELASPPASGLARGFGSRILDRDGAIRWISWRASAPDRDGVRYAVAHDVTPAKIAEAELVQARREAERLSRMKSEFLSSVGRGLVEPLEELMRMGVGLVGGASGPEAERYARSLRGVTEGLVGILNDLAARTVLEPGDVSDSHTRFDLLRTLESVVGFMGLVAADKRVELVLRYDPRAPTRVVGDSTRIRQVLLNLVSRALRSTRMGRVAVDVEHGDRGTDSALFQITVEDTGDGMTPAALVELLERRATPGAGADTAGSQPDRELVLAAQLARAIPAWLGGSSIPGKGTTLSLALCLGLDRSSEGSTPPSLPLDQLGADGGEETGKKERETRAGELEVSDPPGTGIGETPAVPALDPKVVSELLALRTRGGKNYLQSTREVFIRSTDEHLQKLDSAIRHGQVLEVIQLAHFVKGSASNLGASPLSALCKRLEGMGRTGDLRGAAEVLTEIRSEYDRVRSSLEDALR